jgi:hypothetical protein
MVRFELGIELGNDAMRTWAHVRRALRELINRDGGPAQRSPQPGEGGRILDVNGNTVGGWVVLSDDGKE